MTQIAIKKGQILNKMSTITYRGAFRQSRNTGVRRDARALRAFSAACARKCRAKHEPKRLRAQALVVRYARACSQSSAALAIVATKERTRWPMP